VIVSFAGVSQVDDLAFGAEGRSFAPVGGDDRAVGDDVRQAVVLGPFQRVTQVRGLGGGHVDHLIPVPVGGGPGSPMVAGHASGLVRSRNQRRPSTACRKQVNVQLPFGVSRPAPLGGQQPGGELRSALGTSSVAR